MIKIAVVTMIAFPSAAIANGIEWSLGVAGAQPGPVKQSALYLDEEYVVMDESKVTAVFQVMNPSKHDIKTKMGFPLNRFMAAGREDDYAKTFGPENFRECLPNDDVEVLVNGQKVSTTVTCAPKGDYSTVINWTMSYPANKVTQFTVKYPHSGSSLGGGEGSHVSDTKYWSYIVHTGAFWAKPIGKAQFQFCGEPVKSYCKDPSGITTWDADGSRQYNKRVVSIKPKHTLVDCKSNCIIWNRSNWTPVKADDIDVAYEITSQGFYDAYKGFDPEIDLMSLACVKKEIEGKQENKHIGELAQISTTILNDEIIEDIYWSVENQSALAADTPDHVMVIRRLALYRYLRNWIAAVHGHEFKDSKLKECFETVKKESSPYSSVELKNLEFLKKQEEIWSEKRKLLWDNIKMNLEPDNSIAK